MTGSRLFRRFHGSSIPGRKVFEFFRCLPTNPCTFQDKMVGSERKNPTTFQPEILLLVPSISEVFLMETVFFFLTFSASSSRLRRAKSSTWVILAELINMLRNYTFFKRYLTSVKSHGTRIFWK